MPSPLSILQFVRAKRSPDSPWVYGYVSDIGQRIAGVAEWEWIEVRYDNGIKPVTELFAPEQVEDISEALFVNKTRGQTALHSRYNDDKEAARHKVAGPDIDAALGPHVELAIAAVEHSQMIAGCNDYDMPDTPENRALWDEAQAWNVKVPVEKIKSHPDYWPPHVLPNGKLSVSDYIIVYALRKATDTL
jgi:hypothetical protein